MFPFALAVSLLLNLSSLFSTPFIPSLNRMLSLLVFTTCSNCVVSMNCRCYTLSWRKDRGSFFIPCTRITPNITSSKAKFDLDEE